jgi:hypothetical protein
MRTSGVVIVGIALAASAGGLSAQGIRGIATSSARYIEIRPIQRDTIPFSAVQQDANGVTTYEGVPITCVAGFTYCVRYRAGEVENAVAFSQDVSFTVWGFGLQGLSATVLLRVRADGGSFVWPRSDDSFDAMLAYAELDRGRYRVRLGRQRATSGLGFSGYDGASVLYELARPVRVEAFAGRSLARGLDEPRNDALRGIEDFVLDRDAWLYGGSIHAEPRAGISLTARYQREIWSDRSGLLSERAALDFRAPLPGRMALSAAADYDFAFGRVGKSNLTVSAPFAAGRVRMEATARRYVPYFELWTIWGFFDPVAWHEVELRGSWQVGSTLALRGYGGLRKYGDTNAPIILSELPDRAERGGIGVNWRVSNNLILDGDYAVEKGFGAFLSTGSAMARWQALSKLALTASLTAFQQIEEFRIGEGAVIGGGLFASLDVTERSGLDVGANLYRQTFDGRANSPDWNQFRGYASLRIGFGRDPGRSRRP